MTAIALVFASDAEAQLRGGARLSTAKCAGSLFRAKAEFPSIAGYLRAIPTPGLDEETSRSSCVILAPSLIIAHRGASAEAPENTLAAFRLAWERGADGIEGDFYLSKDRRIVCIHDGTTGRVTGGRADLPVAETNFKDLRTLDVGAWKDPRFAGEGIPSLGEVLETVPAGKKVFIEIKCGPEIVPILKGELAKFPQLKPDQVAIISFDETVIAACRKQLPHLTANLLVGFRKDEKTGEWQPSTRAVLASLKKCGASGLGTQARPEVIHREFVDRLREARMGFHCWTVNDTALARTFQSLGVDSITTDRPDFIRKAISQSPGPRRITPYNPE